MKKWLSSGAQHVVPLLALLLVACTFPLAPGGPPPRPTVIVITAQGPYATGFDEADDWLIGDTEGSAGTVKESGYLLTIKKPSFIAWTNQTREFGEGVYEVDARLVSGPEASAFGLLLLASPDLASFVYVTITDDGRYDIGRCENYCRTQDSLIGGFTLSYSIQTGEQTNHLRIELAGGVLSLNINGAPVSQITGVEPPRGLLGFIGESSQYGGFVAGFDNLQVIEIGGPPTAAPVTATPIPVATSPPLIEPTPFLSPAP